MKWISVKDGLPESYESVLISGKFIGDLKTTTNEAYYDGRQWNSIRNYSTLESVTHWMPLPEPPKD